MTAKQAFFLEIKLEAENRARFDEIKLAFISDGDELALEFWFS